MAETSRHDAWQAGNSYEAYMGRWSRQIAPCFLDWLGAPNGLDYRFIRGRSDRTSGMQLVVNKGKLWESSHTSGGNPVIIASLMAQRE